MKPFLADDSVPTEDDIEWVVKHLHNHHSGGASGMRAQHNKRWLAAVRKAEKDATMTVGEETIENKGTMAFQTSMEPTEAAN